MDTMMKVVAVCFGVVNATACNQCVCKRNKCGIPGSAAANAFCQSLCLNSQYNDCDAIPSHGEGDFGRGDGGDCKGCLALDSPGPVYSDCNAKCKAVAKNNGLNSDFASGRCGNPGLP